MNLQKLERQGVPKYGAYEILAIIRVSIDLERN